MNNREVFDKIAESWYNYRHWTIFRPELEALAAEWRKGKLLNVGCGHGADFLPFRAGFDLHGVDFSANMLELARKYSKKFDFPVTLAQADFRHLPYEDAAFDWAIAVASYHHLLDKTDQRQAFAELKRVLKPGGEAFVTVWNRCQPRFWLKPKRVRVPWRAAGETLYRDYYLFTYGEIESLARRAGFAVISIAPESAYRGPVKLFSRNICLRLRRVA